MKTRCFHLLVATCLLSGCESDLNRGLVHNDRLGPAGSPSPRTTPSQRGANVAALSPGLPCRIDMIRPAGEGQAYEGTVVRVDDKAVVLSNVYSEGPTKRSRAPNIGDVMDMRMPWASPKTTIDWERLPDKELRVARAEIATVKVLDHDPSVDFYAR